MMAIATSGLMRAGRGVRQELNRKSDEAKDSDDLPSYDPISWGYESQGADGKRMMERIRLPDVVYMDCGCDCLLDWFVNSQGRPSCVVNAVRRGCQCKRLHHTVASKVQRELEQITRNAEDKTEPLPAKLWLM